MNIFEYLEMGIKNKGLFQYDNQGNMRIDWEKVDECEGVNIDLHLSRLCSYKKPYFMLEEDIEYIPKEKVDKLLQYEILIDRGVESYDAPRRSYYRMRGKKVTPEQAFEIIRRTDNYFYGSEVSRLPDYIHCINFDNWLFDKNHSPQGYGWIHVDGTVGSNTITQKYPDVDEYIAEWFEKMVAFPFLNLIICVTEWNEMSPEGWGAVYEQRKNWHYKDADSGEEAFLNAVEIGICIHDGKLEILNKANAVERYKEYVELYESTNKYIYVPEYYQDQNIIQADDKYLERCLKAYGIR